MQTHSADERYCGGGPRVPGPIVFLHYINTEVDQRKTYAISVSDLKFIAKPSKE